MYPCFYAHLYRCQCIAIIENASPCSTSPYSTSPYSTSPYSTSPYSTSPYSTSHYSTSPYSTSPYSTSPYSNSPHSTSPYSTSAYSTSPYCFWVRRSFFSHLLWLIHVIGYPSTYVNLIAHRFMYGSYAILISKYVVPYCKGSFYIAQYPVRWTAQSALHFLPPLTDLFIPTPTRLLREAF